MGDTPMGYVMLQGGAEFGGHMKSSDQRAISLAGGLQAPVGIIPAAAAPDDNHLHAGRNGQQWFRNLGARDVSLIMVVDRASAKVPQFTTQIRNAKLIYMLGGFPAYLADVIRGSPCWHAMLAAFNRGAVLAGSSAGAMVLCDLLFNPGTKTLTDGLGLLPGCCVIPHHNTFGRQWLPQLQKDLPRATLIGIDEQTGMINDGTSGEWNIYGPGAVTIYSHNQVTRHFAGESFKGPVAAVTI